MSLTRDIRTIALAGQTVTVVGKAGPINATWRGQDCPQTCGYVA